MRLALSAASTAPVPRWSRFACLAVPRGSQWCASWPSPASPRIPPRGQLTLRHWRSTPTDDSVSNAEPTHTEHAMTEHTHGARDTTTQRTGRQHDAIGLAVSQRSRRAPFEVAPLSCSSSHGERSRNRARKAQWSKDRPVCALQWDDSAAQGGRAESAQTALVAAALPSAFVQPPLPQ